MYQLLFELLQIALGNREHLSRSYTVPEWTQAYKLAKEQAGAVCFGAIEKLSPDRRPPHGLLLKWIGLAETSRRQYLLHKNVLYRLSDFYKRQGVRLFLMKGYGLSLDYPVPELRPVGDIDVYLISEVGKMISDGTIKEYADQVLERCWGIKIERGYRKHSHFAVDGVLIENHETFIDTDKHKSNVRFQSYLEHLLRENSNRDDTQLNNVVLLKESPISNCYIPPATWNALFLLRHAGEHFATEKISLRHLLDLGTFFQSHSTEIDWEFVLDVYKKENLMDFYNAIATICIRKFGIDQTYFYGYTSCEKLADKVLDDIFTEYESLPMSNDAPREMGIIRYGVVKSCRWWKNRWKYKLVYNESLWESFWGLAVNRLNS